jgi:hypothetical protein
MGYGWTEEEYENYINKSKLDNKTNIKKHNSSNTLSPKLSESEIQSQIKSYLKLQGWFVFKNHQSLGSHKGIADLYAIKNGKSIWIEVKTSKGKQSEDQIKFQINIEASGGTYKVARSVHDVINL